MSGIYIPGMEMPTGNPEEPTAVWIYPDGGVKAFYNCGKEIINTHAIPVLDHGRLGDLDKLEKSLRLCAKYQIGDRQQGILGCCETIRFAPTVIPAEEDDSPIITKASPASLGIYHKEAKR